MLLEGEIPAFAGMTIMRRKNGKEKEIGGVRDNRAGGY